MAAANSTQGPSQEGHPASQDPTIDPQRNSAEAETVNPPAWLKTEKDRYYWVRYTAIRRNYYSGRKHEAFAAADDLATDPGLPILVRAGCHMMLATNDDDPAFVQHARFAVKILEEECPKLVKESALDESSIPAAQVIEARRILQEAEEIAEERRQEEDDSEEEEVEGEEVDVPREGEEDMSDDNEAAEEQRDKVSELPKVSKQDERLLREAAGFIGGTTTRHGLVTPGTSGTVTRMPSNKSGGSVTRQSSRKTEGGDDGSGRA